MPLNPLDYLPLAAKAAQGLCRRCHAIADDDAHGQALLELLLLIPRYDPARHPDPGKYLAWMLKRRLIDWARQGLHFRRPGQREIPKETLRTPSRPSRLRERHHRSLP